MRMEKRRVEGHVAEKERNWSNKKIDDVVLNKVKAKMFMKN